MIELTHVTKRYGKETVLKDVSVSFYPGAVYGLVGPNGSGKTTLMCCICGLVRPTLGCVKVNGKIIGKDADFPQSTGIILEAPDFLPQHSGMRNLLLPANSSRRANKKRAAEVMRLLDLDPQLKKPVGQYSLGMRQRLGIARALMEDPEILILDEPFNGLDEQGMAKMHSLFQEWRIQGKIILLASHRAQDIMKACDVVYEINAGVLKSASRQAPSRPKEEMSALEGVLALLADA